jgi:hypothetical protein
MTSTNLVCSANTYNFSRDVLPRLRARSYSCSVRVSCYSICNDPMIPRRISRRCISREPHVCCTKGTNTWCCSIHHQRSVLLCIAILSLRGLTKMYLCINTTKVLTAHMGHMQLYSIHSGDMQDSFGCPQRLHSSIMT